MVLLFLLPCKMNAIIWCSCERWACTLSYLKEPSFKRHGWQKARGSQAAPKLRPLLNVPNIKLDHGLTGYGKVFYSEKIVAVGVPRENVFDSVVKEWEDTKNIFSVSVLSILSWLLFSLISLWSWGFLTVASTEREWLKSNSISCLAGV